MEFYKEVERNIIKKYRKELYRPFVKALDKYELIKENDKIMLYVLSGGKDSFLMAKLYSRNYEDMGSVPFECSIYVVMDPGYNRRKSRTNRRKC